MSAARTFQNLALVGFMGAGKSSVGRLAAAQLGFQFVDTDGLIEERVGKPVAAIFAGEGEAAFRTHERAVLTDLKKRRQTVIATGGGLVTQKGNLASLKAHALVVCLWASPRTIWQRVRRQSHRPLLQTPDPQARIEELLAERKPFYRQADVLINTDERPLREVAHQVIHQFQLARGQADPP